MIDKANAKSRAAIAISRCKAIGGQIETALSMIDNRLGDRPITEMDQVALFMARAEYLHLDNRDVEAYDIVQKKIEPLLPLVGDEIAVVVGYNRADIAFGLLKSDDFYGTVDLGANLAISLWGHQRLFSAQRAANAGKHYESLPAVWRELHRTYLQGCWGPFRFASSHMAIECLKLGWPDEAAFHAVMAQDQKTVDAVGQQLAKFRNGETIGRAVDKILSCSQLHRHFTCGAQLLLELHDSIPEEMMSKVFEWSLRRAATVPASLNDRHTLTVAWQFLELIANRLDSAQASALIDTAVKHPIWHEQPSQPNQVILFRKEMLQTIRCVVQRCTGATLDQLIDAIAPLANERKQQHDFEDAIEVLCQVAEVGGAEARERIRQMLYPNGKRLNAVLLQVAAHFGQEINKPSEIGLGAERVADNIKLQVQRIPVGSEAKPVDSTYFTKQCDRDGVRYVISITSTADVVAILKHKDMLPRKPLHILVNAMLDMVEEPDNSIANKRALVDALEELGNKCTGTLRRRMWDVLSKLARGEITESPLFMTAADAANPLNPFKMASGKPSELQAAALCTLASLDTLQRGVWSQKLDSIVMRAIADAQGDVRTAACWAVKAMRDTSAATLHAVLFAARDPEPMVVEVAFNALAEKVHADCNEAVWQMVCTSCEHAATNEEVRIRRAAAFASARLVARCAIPGIKKRLDAARKIFGADVCHSVRNEANSQPKRRPTNSKPRSSRAHGAKRAKLKSKR